MTTSSVSSRQSSAAVENDEIDLGFMIGPYDNPDIRSVTLSTETLYLVAPRGHALLDRPRTSPEEIVAHPLILGDMAEWGEYRYRLEDCFGQLGLRLSPALEASNTLALIGLVAAGLGVTIYPESLLGVLPRNIEVRPIAHPLFVSRTVLAWKRSNHTRALMNFIAEATGRRA